MWYSAHIIFESEVDGAEPPSLVEHSIRLIQAGDEAEARVKAAALGRSEEVSYRNDAGQSVRWRFVDVRDVQDLCVTELQEGVEVYSTLNWKAVDGDRSPPHPTRESKDQAVEGILRTAGSLTDDDEFFDNLEQIRRDRRLDTRREIDLDE